MKRYETRFSYESRHTSITVLQDGKPLYRAVVNTEAEGLEQADAFIAKHSRKTQDPALLQDNSRKAKATKYRQRRNETTARLQIAADTINESENA